MKITIIGSVIMMIMYCIAVNTTKGRVSRREHAYLKLIFLIGSFIFFPFILFLSRTNASLITILAGILFLWFCYTMNIKTNVKRFHDIGYSGWYLILSTLPIIHIFFLYFLYFKKGKYEINQYDISIDYIEFMKKMKLYPEHSLIQHLNNEYVINEREFKMAYITYHNGKKIFRCPKHDFDNYFNKKEYFLENFSIIDEHDCKLQSFEFSDDDISKMEKDLRSIVVHNDRFVFQGIEIFVRHEDFKYAILIELNQQIPFGTSNYCQKKNPYYSHFLLTKEQLCKLLKESSVCNIANHGNNNL